MKRKWECLKFLERRVSRNEKRAKPHPHFSPFLLLLLREFPAFPGNDDALFFYHLRKDRGVEEEESRNWVFLGLWTRVFERVILISCSPNTEIEDSSSRCGLPALWQTDLTAPHLLRRFRARAPRQPLGTPRRLQSTIPPPPGSSVRGGIERVR